MAHPQVVDRGNGLQMWRVAANILNKQSRTADRGWPSSSGFGGGLTTLHRQKTMCCEIFTRSAELEGFCLVVAEIRERLAVSKRPVNKMDMDRFDLK
jgi:hypothetical protein